MNKTNEEMMDAIRRLTDEVQRCRLERDAAHNAYDAAQRLLRTQAEEFHRANTKNGAMFIQMKEILADGIMAISRTKRFHRTKEGKEICAMLLARLTNTLGEDDPTVKRLKSSL
jgi:hypothetical protein